MSGTEYLDFVRDPENKDRFFLNMKNVVLECSKEEYLRNRAEKRRSDYLAEGKKDWTIISLFAQKDKETSGEEVIPDLETDVEEEIIHTITLQKLREVLARSQRRMRNCSQLCICKRHRSLYAPIVSKPASQ